MYSLNSMSSNPNSAGFDQAQNSMQSGMAPQAQNYNTMQGGMGPQQMQHFNSMPGYAHGGRPKRGKLVMAHFNPKELDVMDHLQGKIEKCPRSGMRSYTHLEELLKNPHILSGIHHHSQKHHAQGGHINGYAQGGYVQPDAANGENGDTELALIGPHTHHILSQLALPGTIRNHIDGRPQYWSLGGVLGGLWDTIKSGASAVAPYIGAAGKAIMPVIAPQMQSLATSRFGPIGTALSTGLQGLADKGFSALENMGSNNQRANATTLGEGVRSAADAYRGGASASQSLGAGLNRAGSRFSGGLGGAMQGAGSALQAGRGYGDVARQAATGGYRGAGGSQGILNTAKNMMSQYQSGASPRQITRSVTNNAFNQAMPTQDSMSNQDAFAELPFANDYE